MADVIILPAAKRAERGSTACRRLRRQGLVPANVYGHEIDPVAVTVKDDDLRSIITSGSQVVDLKIDGATEKALIRDVQWDTFSTHVQHLDFLRVDPKERVEVEIPIHLRGTAAGTLANGILEQPLHALNVECPAVEIPDEIEVKIHDLQIGDAIHVGDLRDLPPNLTVLDPEDAVIVQVTEAVMPEEEEEPEEGLAAAAEPEVIGREEGEEDESSEG